MGSNTGKLIVFSAPSGSGKTTIVRELLKRDLGLEFSISAASREARGKEIHAKDYYFLSIEDFKKKIDEDAFLEWEEVYPDNFYGTLKSEVDRIWSEGKHVIFDIDVVGGLNIKKQFDEKCLSIFVMPPSIEELRKRLETRDTESEEKINMRISKAKREIEYAEDFDYILYNKVIEDAQSEACKIVSEFISK